MYKIKISIKDKGLVIILNPSLQFYISFPVHVNAVHTIHVVAAEPVSPPPHVWLELGNENFYPFFGLFVGLK